MRAGFVERRYNEQSDEWTLQSDFDGDELLSRLARVTVDTDTIRRFSPFAPGMSCCVVPKTS
jgi:hypothetical protein